MSNGASTASLANLQEFLNTYVCQANKNGTGYFYFEAFDEEWKVSQKNDLEQDKIYLPIIPGCALRWRRRPLGSFQHGVSCLRSIYLRDLTPFFYILAKASKTLRSQAVPDVLGLRMSMNIR
jgi:hypothetical protein